MTPENFIREYEKALATQNWLLVEPLISDDASVTFSNGHTHHGKSEVRIAFEKNFSAIKNEKYTMANIRWLLKNNSVSVYTFDFKWKGSINEQPAEGAGIGTAVIVNKKGDWQLLTEHLGTAPKK